MTEVSDRYRKVADSFSERAAAVPEGKWDAPSPCEGWTARDIVRHMVETSGFFLGRVGVELPRGPSVDEDPVGAWTVGRDVVQSTLDDPELASQEFDMGMGPSTFEKTVGMFGIGDVLVHTWDLARATGQDETLDPDECRRLYATMEPNDERMRQGTSFGPKVEVPADVDDQTKLLAFTGRQP